MVGHRICAGNGRQIETAVFFDHVAYNRFSAIYSDDEIEAMVLAYVNQVNYINLKLSILHIFFLILNLCIDTVRNSHSRPINLTAKSLIIFMYFI